MESRNDYRIVLTSTVEGVVNGTTKLKFSCRGVSLVAAPHKIHTGYIIPKEGGAVAAAAAVTVAGV